MPPPPAPIPLHVRHADARDQKRVSASETRVTVEKGRGENFVSRRCVRRTCSYQKSMECRSRMVSAEDQ